RGPIRQLRRNLFQVKIISLTLFLTGNTIASYYVANTVRHFLYVQYPIIGMGLDFMEDAALSYS
ncbi:hypothetical protein, partial [Clostridium sp. UBA6640]|uniref:hypothetical protein n=1 Tax=Clostridium sp. UBA6640 TaxID=1946370 RepID=UPI0025C3965F